MVDFLEFDVWNWGPHMGCTDYFDDSLFLGWPCWFGQISYGSRMGVGVLEVGFDGFVEESLVDG
jgi:hypothetical protein